MSVPTSKTTEQTVDNGAAAVSSSPSPPIAPMNAKRKKQKKKEDKKKKVQDAPATDQLVNEQEEKELVVILAADEVKSTEIEELVPIDLHADQPQAALIDVGTLPADEHATAISDEEIVPDDILLDLGQTSAVVQDEDALPGHTGSPLRAHVAEPHITSAPVEKLRSAETLHDQSLPRLSSGTAPNAISTTVERPRHTRPVSIQHGSSSPPPSLLQPHFLSSIHNQNFYAKAQPAADHKGWWNETCHRFDTFTSSGDSISAFKVKDALLVGGDGCLDIYRALPNKMEVVGRLEGLRGLVVDAKVLPALAHVETDSLQLPLVAVVLHAAITDQDSHQTSTSDVKLQAIVQVYSLRTQKLISTLFSSLAATAPQGPSSEPSTSFPDILGCLRLQAAGPYLTVSASVSGEVYVFHHGIVENQHHDFRCVAKFWTSLTTIKPANVAKNNTAKEDAETADQTPPLPLLALGERWLVISCPSSSSRISIQGTPLMSDSYGSFGVASHNPPVQSNISAEALAMNAEGVVSRFTRQAAHEVLKASRKGFELGLAGWREFTSPSQPERPVSQAKTEGEMSAFPPTHAPVDTHQRSQHEPAILSVIDLNRFINISVTNPKPQVPFAATFAIEDGCNFISLSNDGLSLLTANRSGEVSAIWSLRHAFYSSVAYADSADLEVEGPYVQCTYRMQRNSPCIVTDAVWSQSDSELAIRTANGTTHLHYLPTDRRREQSGSQSGATGRARSESKSGVSGKASPSSSPPSAYGVLDSIRSGWQSVSTQVNTIRSSATTAQPFDISSTFAGLRATSGRVLAKGLASGYSAARTGVGDLWHADDNKIRSGDPVGSASLRWIQTADSMCFGVVHAGKMSIHTILRVARMRGKAEFIGLKVEKGSRMDFVLPASGSPSSTDKCWNEGPHGFWSLRSVISATPSTPRKTAHNMMDTIEDDVLTNPHFCPFHVDPRVTMMVFSVEGEAQQHAQTNISDGGFWSFGEPLPLSIKVNSDHTALADLLDYDGSADALYESRVTVNPVSQEIAVRSHRVEGREDNGADEPAATAAGWNNRFDD